MNGYVYLKIICSVFLVTFKGAFLGICIVLKRIRGEYNVLLHVANKLAL